MEANWLNLLLQKNSLDPLERLKLGNVLLSEVSQRKISPHSKLVNDFLDVLGQWLTGSNFKVTIIGLEILNAALQTSPEVLASYYFDRVAIFIERMGDSKQQVRDLSIRLLLRLSYLENSSPVMILDRLCCPATGFTHKQWLVKVGSMILLREFLVKSFALVIQQTIQLIPQLCRLSNDPNPEVRDVSTNVLVDMMVFGGQPIVARISATRLINDQKMTTLMQRYQSTLSTRGNLPPKQSVTIDLPTQRNSLIRRSLRSPAKIVHPSRLSTPPRNSPAPTTPPSTTTIISPLGNNFGANRSRESMRSPRSVKNAAGTMSVSRYRSSSSAPVVNNAVNQDDFRKAFTAVPKTSIFSNYDARSKLESAKVILSNSNEDWSKRANQLKLIRSVILNSDETIDQKMLISQINNLSDAFDFSIRDLRSQIVRETAVTCSFLLETYGMELRQMGEAILMAALGQVSVSTKIIASSAATLTIFIIEKIQTRQIFQIISELSSSKAKEQRRHLAILLETLLIHWDSKNKLPLIETIGRLIKNALNDADSETRVAGRKAFHKLEQLHCDVADSIFKELDASKQKMLKEGVASSSSSLNSDRENQNNNLIPKQTANISQKFLAQRSASAVDSKLSFLPRQFSAPKQTTSSGVRLPQSTSTSFSAVTSSKVKHNTTPSPSTSTHQQTPIQRVASNLGSSSFVGSLTVEQASNLQEAMDKARDEMNRQSNDDDDEFLLKECKSQTTTPTRGTPTITENHGIDQIIRGCTSASSNEKREAIKSLAAVLSDSNNFTVVELKQIGDVLTRLLAEGNTTMLVPILEATSIFVRAHHEKLEMWLKLALGKLFAKLGAESLPNIRSALLATQKSFLVSFDPILQLKSVCEFMCDPVHLLVPKARLSLLEYLCLLFEEIWPEDQRYLNRDTIDTIDTNYTRLAIRKMFTWMFDQRSGPLLMQSCERLICAMFALNAADFTKIFNDLSPECRDWAYRILQLNGQQQQQQQQQNLKNETKNGENNNYKIVSSHNHNQNTSNMEDRSNSSIRDSNAHYQSVTTHFEPRKSTAHLAENLAAQSIYIREQLDSLRVLSDPQRVNEAMANLHGMMCEGSFSLWNQFFDELLDNIYQILTIPMAEIRKKLALRILAKMCNAQASRLFDKTETTILKILHASITSSDLSTMSVAAEDCLRTLSTHLPLPQIIKVSRRVLSQDDDARSVLILKMLTRMFQEIDGDELSLIVDDVAPCFVEAYESTSMSVRKCAVFGLVELVRRLGHSRMSNHLQSLNSSKLNLIDLYIDRAKSSESCSSSSNC